MNTSSRVVVAGLVLIIAAGLVYVFVRKDAAPNTATQPVADQPIQKQTPAAPSAPAVQKGTYTDYTTEKVANTSGVRLLFFHAPWCPQCRALEADIKAASLPDNVTIFKVDYDTNQSLRSKYGVTIQTTVVKINDAAEKLESYVAYDQPTFASVERVLLK